MNNYFLKRNSINLDITTKCTLACSKCLREYNLSKGRSIQGKTLSISEYKNS